ncbi:hypothetical protein EQV77_06735 [Halobacillus fulvus]|nr:hypothetical protein EQV77_06735 [Halobacillus fulvus]
MSSSPQRRIYLKEGENVLLQKKNLWFLVGLTALYLLLFGTTALTAEPEGYSGLEGHPSLSQDDQTLVFSYFHNGDASLYKAGLDGKAEIIAEPEEGYSYIRPTFAPDGKTIAFIQSWDVEETPYQQLMLYKNGQVEPLLDQDRFVTEAVFSPDGTYLYYLQSDVYRNYSDIAQERPHDFDVYRMNIETEKVDQITNEQGYDFSSLHVWPDGNISYRTFEGESFGGRDVLKIVNPETKESKTVTPEQGGALSADQPPIFSSPTPSPSGEKVAFSDVGSLSSKGTYQYEIFFMDPDGTNVEQVTNFHEYAGNPVFFHNDDRLLVSIDWNFAGGEPDYEYWIINGDDRKEWVMKLPEKSEGDEEN